jgi:hypothetical protein
MTLPPEAPIYRLYRKMDGELVLQYFVPSRINDDFSMDGKWENIPTVNEDQNGMRSSNAS